MMSTFLEVLFSNLNAEFLNMSRDDYLSAVAFLRAPDPLAEARRGPDMPTQNTLHRIAWALNLDMRVLIRPRSA